MDEFTLFEKALEITDANQRERFLDESCAGNPAQRQRLEMLLANAQRSFALLEQRPTANRFSPNSPLPKRQDR
jgi:hypothetical protein